MNPIYIIRSSLLALPLCLCVIAAPNVRKDLSLGKANASPKTTDQQAKEAVTVSDEVINQKMAEVMGLATEFKKAPVVKKMARFLLDFGGSNDLNSGYTTSDGTANLFNLDIDSAAVMEGVFKPENVAIHVGQNAFNFFTSSLAWLVASSLYQNTNSGRSLYAAGGDSYSSNSGYSASSSSGFSTNKATYSSPSNQYGAPLVASHKSTNVSPLDLLSKTLTASSSFFNPFGASHSAQKRPQAPRYTPPSPHGYESRKVVLDAQPTSIEEDIDNLSIDEIQAMLEAQERGLPTIMDDLSDAQKYRVYKKVQSAVGSRRKGLAAKESGKKKSTTGKYMTQPSITFADGESITERSNLVLPEAQQHHASLTVGPASSAPSGVTQNPGTPVRRRRRKQIKNKTPKKIEE